MSKHKNKHHQHNNPLKELEKFIMSSVNELLAAIATIARGNQTDPAVLAQINTLNTQMAANNAKLVTNDADDAQSRAINADQQTLIEALIHQLANSNPPAIPVVSGASLAAGSIGGGETVTLSGTGFTGATAVNFGTVAATSFSVASDTSLTCVAPTQAAGTINIIVTTPAGVSLVGTANEYTYA